MPKHRLTVQRAATEKAEQDSWRCESCDTLIEHGRFCCSCESYWEDVQNGLFNYDWEFDDN